MLMILMLMFVLFNGLFSIAPSYTSLAISRFAAGLPRSLFGVGSVVATNLAKKEKKHKLLQ